jgi:hypothetical protein
MVDHVDKSFLPKRIVLKTLARNATIEQLLTFVFMATRDNIHAWPFTNIYTHIPIRIEKISHGAIDVEAPNFQHVNIEKMLGKFYLKTFDEFCLLKVCHGQAIKRMCNV